MNFPVRGNAGSPVDAGRLGFAALVTSLFLVLVAVGASRHELWRDEMQAWLIARDVPNLSALFEQAHYEGAPPLWHLLLRPLTLVTHRPEAMQILTGLLAGITIFLFSFYAPFSRILKALLVCNYYLLFEYGLVCRNYLPGLLCLTVACILFPLARERPWAFAISLIAAALASVHSLIVAVAMAAGHWGSRVSRAGRNPGSRNAGAATLCWLSWVAFMAGVGLAVYSMIPRPDTFYGPASEWIFNWNPDRLAKVAWALVSAHFPLPRPPGFFWIPPWDMPSPAFDHNAAFVLALALFGVVVFRLRRHTGGLIFYLVGTLGISAFLYVRFLGTMRHTGFLFFTSLFALWIGKAGSLSHGSRCLVRKDWAVEFALGAMLATQAVTGLWAAREDFRQPFSCGQRAARVVSERHLREAFMAVGPDWAGTTLAGYLDRTVYYPNGRRYGSFTGWNTRRIDEISDEEFLRRAVEQANGAEMVISLDHPLPEDFLQRHGVESLARLEGSLTPFENYYLFFVPRRIGSPDQARAEKAELRSETPAATAF